MNILSSIAKRTEEAMDIAQNIAGRAEDLLNDADQRASIGLAGTPLGPAGSVASNPLAEIASGLRPARPAAAAPATPVRMENAS